MRFTGYDLLSSGGGQRLEQWGGRVVLRPETAAVWPWPHGKSLPEWDGHYHGTTASGGRWEWRSPLPDPCIASHGKLSFRVKPTASKHLGLFPEQSANWDWIATRLASAPPSQEAKKILNLFGYTGGATLAAAAAGASVTHVDSSKAMVSWCSENARLSGLGEAPIRYIVEDAMTFLHREIRRGNRYDGIVMDPPSYGRGKGGQLWKLSEHLPTLLEASLDVLSGHPLFILLNTYSGDLDEEAGDLLESMSRSKGGRVENVTLGLTGSLDAKFLPLGQAHRWSPPGESA
jgi:23S rRNA (cytosine1962-C5)-methyltransferase